MCQSDKNQQQRKIRFLRFSQDQVRHSTFTSSGNFNLNFESPLFR